MSQMTILEVGIWCKKCQRNLLRAVAGLQGLDSIAVDESKGLLTVIGQADPCEIVGRARKASKHADIVSVGPPSAPQQMKPAKSKDSPKPKDTSSNKFPYCHGFVVIQFDEWVEPNLMCPIL